MKILDFSFFFQYFDNYECALKNRIIDIQNRLIRSDINMISASDLNELQILYIQIDILRKIYRDLKEFYRDL